MPITAQVLMEIRRRHGPDITVIMISSNDQEQMVESCIREGADSYIIKPLRMSGRRPSLPHSHPDSQPLAAAFRPNLSPPP